MASKLLYEFSVATGKKVDDLSVYGRTMTLFKGAQVWGRGGGALHRPLACLSALSTQSLIDGLDPRPHPICPIIVHILKMWIPPRSLHSV